MLQKQVDISAEEFWQFSVQFYEQANVQENLLCLQDNFGLNVNIVLFIIYLRVKGLGLSAQQLKVINTKNQKLDSLTSNLRATRRSLKAQNIVSNVANNKYAEYQNLLAQELELEREQQATIISVTLDLEVAVQPVLNKVSEKKFFHDKIVHIVKVSDNLQKESFAPVLDVLIDRMIKYRSFCGGQSNDC